MSPSEKYLLFGLGLLFMGFLLGLNYPLISIFNVPTLWEGIPSLFLYVFGLWLMVILVAFVLVNWQEKED